MVKYNISSSDIQEKPYPVAFRARMHSEGFVRLGTPVLLSGSLLSAYKELCQASSADDWLDGVIALKQKAKAVDCGHSHQQSLFSNI